jgi:hypothetical protein
MAVPPVIASVLGRSLQQVVMAELRPTRAIRPLGVAVRFGHRVEVAGGGGGVSLMVLAELVIALASRE